MDKLSFYINKKIVYVVIERTTNKNMYLKIKDKDIIVSAPKRTSLKTINSFVSKHIEKFVKYIEDKKVAQLYSIEDKFIWVLGKKYDFKILTGFTKNKLVKKEERIYIETKTGSDVEIKKVIKDYLKTILLKYIEEVSPNFEKQLNVPSHKIKVVYKTRTWGTNMILKRTISYSSRLAHYDTAVIDYVIIHELAHFHEPNHQQSFWKIVGLQMPNYKVMQKQLKEDQALSEE